MTIRNQPIPRTEKIYSFLASFFVTILVLTNIIGTKLFVLHLPTWLSGRELTLTTGILTYPLTFWFTDVVSEIYGKKRADMMVFIGFLASLLMLATLFMAKAMPPAEIWRIGPEFAGFYAREFHVLNQVGETIGVNSQAAQSAFAFAFDAPGTLLFASMLAYMIAQFTDNYLFHFWRRLTGERHLWLRNNGSTSISQLLDTIIVNSIFLHFYWKLPLATIGQIIITTYLVKLVMALADTPLIYAGVFIIKKYIGSPARTEQISNHDVDSAQSSRMS